jgi:S-adenosyl methyltransferase
MHPRLRIPPPVSLDVGPPACSARPRFDPSVPHPARVYGFWLGGKDHYPADRQAAEEVIRRRPQVVAGARANRAFLARVVRYLAATCGIRQFIDIGPGLPAPGNTHDVAQAIVPDSNHRMAAPHPRTVPGVRRHVRGLSPHPRIRAYHH